MEAPKENKISSFTAHTFSQQKVSSSDWEQTNTIVHKSASVKDI